MLHFVLHKCKNFPKSSEKIRPEETTGRIRVKGIALMKPLQKLSRNRVKKYAPKKLRDVFAAGRTGCGIVTMWIFLHIMFGVNTSANNKHLSNIYEDGELTEDATVSKMEIVQTEEEREVKRKLSFYNLDAIISVGLCI